VNCQNYLTQLVANVYYDLGEPSDYTPARLTAWFIDDSNLGKLNNLIGTSFSGVAYRNNNGMITGYGVSPEPNNDQLAIYKMIFDCDYLKIQSRNLAKSSATIGNDWTDLREGDSSIKKINKNEISKNFRGLAQDCKAELDKAAKMYLKYNAIPDQVAGDDTEGVSHYIIQEYQRTLN
jgi:hypothetical protein